MRILLSGLAVWFVCLATYAQAAIQVGDKVRLYRGPGSSGGIFEVDDLGPLGTGEGASTAPYDFDTFCVEIGEFISIGGPIYTVNGISTHNDATNTPAGAGGVSNPRNLTTQVAWLYTQFRSLNFGALSALGFSRTVQNANALQLGIWRGMGYSDTQIQTATGWNLATLNPVVAPWSTAAINAGASWTGGLSSPLFGDVRIMNLFDASGHKAQDQLVLIPPGPNPDPSPVPEPATLMIWATLTGVGLLSTRRKG